MNTTKEQVPKNAQFTKPQKELVKKLATQYSDIEEAYKEFKKSYPWYKWRKFFYIEVDQLLKTNFFDSYVPLNRVGRPKSKKTKRRSRISLTAEQFKEMYILVLRGNKSISQVMKDAGYANESAFYYYRDKYKDQIPHSLKEIGLENNKIEDIKIKEPIDVAKEKKELSEHLDQLFPKPTNIEDEVNLILERKYRSLNCYIEREYNINDYINMFDMLIYLAKNSEDIRTKSLNQTDIDEYYRRDIEHAIELEEERDYKQLDKLHILGNKRRKSKETYEDISLLSPYLNIVNIKEAEKVLAQLKEKKKQRENSKYIPRVDNTMVDKYDWCKSGNINSKVLNTPLVTTSTTISKIKTALPTFRVKVELWGYKGEAFHEEYIDFQANSNIQAREMAEKHFKKKLNQEKLKVPFYIMDIYKLP